MLLVLLVLLLIYYSEYPSTIKDTDTAALSLSVAEIIALTSMAGWLSWTLHKAMGNDGIANQSIAREWLILTSSLVFGMLVTMTHFWGWVPVELAALLALPSILIPPLIYRVHPHHRNSPAITAEEVEQVQNGIHYSPIASQFILRYPNSQIYLYKCRHGHSGNTGGMLLYNREEVGLSDPTFLEVTLDCPFAQDFGTLAQGQEKFQAYLSRYRERGRIVSVLPPGSWEEWLTGMKKSDWYACFNEMDRMEITHPDPSPLPYPLLRQDLVSRLINAPAGVKP